MGTFSGARRHVLHTFANTAERADAEAGLAVTWSAATARPAWASGSAASRSRSRSPAWTSPRSPPCPWSRLAEVVAPYADDPASADPRFGRPPREGDRRPADRAGPGRHGSSVLLDLGLGYLAMERGHADALARRAAAAPAGHPGPVEPLRRRLRPGRALGRAPPGRHRGPAAGARPPEGLGQLALRRRARPRRDPPRRLDRRRRPRRRPSTGATSSTAARPRA